MIKSTRSLGAIAGALGTAALFGLGASAFAAASNGRVDTGTSYAALTHTAGGFDYIAGTNSDKLFGACAVTFKLKTNVASTPGTVSVTAKRVVLFTSTGALTGTGSSTVIASANGSTTITNGKLNLNKGSGGQTGHTFVGTFTGTGTAAGRYVFHYKGTYK
jgi:hypothetical protein